MTLFEALRKDHDVQRDLLERLLGTQGDSEIRDQLYQRLRAELQYHAAAEERALYIPMMEIDMTQEKARHSVAEHHEIDEMIKVLDATGYSSPGWLANARKLQDLVLHHLEEEEHEVFQLAGRALDDARKAGLCDEYRQEMARQHAR
ncbi:hemerythrin domain-containing protein [Billgrantia endophytica]|uniref:Hemerythrin n=1 Tax=Billgrantia endophytica TaxID=2033802 RepID=A0A2N7TYW3_9GAMM|nr:hemerythrin domain-containing protein [Halomonas endophytica]PMR73369.1 hemerythrin [Halomonas endophytica]